MSKKSKEEQLKDIYYESGIWRKYNWYDFLEKLYKIINNHRDEKRNDNKRDGLNGR